MGKYSVKAIDIPKVQLEYTELWEIVKEYWKVQPSEDEFYWNSVKNALDKYYCRHKTENAKGLAVHLLNELDRRRKEVYEEK